MSKKNQKLEDLLPDTVRTSWVNAKAPKWSVPYLRLSRIDRPIGTWLLLLPCWWGCLLAAGSDERGFQIFDLWIIIGCTIGSILMRGAGCTWNDLVDRKLDAEVSRTQKRPIPAKDITLRLAYLWLGLQLTLAFLVLITFNKNAIIVGLCSILPVMVYPFAKRFTWWPQVFLGIAFNWGILFAWTAHTGSLGSPAILLYLAGIIWTLFYDTIYAHQDVDDDLLIGIKSTAILFGKNTKKWLTVFILLIWFCYMATILAVFTHTTQQKEIIISIAGLTLFIMHLSWQNFRVDLNDWNSCLYIFQSNRDAGLIIVISLTLICIL